MAGLHCSDCAFSSFKFNEDAQMYQAYCSRGYLLADPHIHEHFAMHFAKSPEDFVPVKDPFNREYLRKSYICGEFIKRKDNLG